MMREMILLGAGASVEAGVPDTYGMTSKIMELFRKDYLMQRYVAVISFVIGGLLFQHGIKGRDPLQEGVNVEELFNAVQLLAERNTLEAAPFVESWHPMVQELDRARLHAGSGRLYWLIYDRLVKAMESALGSLPSGNNRTNPREFMRDWVSRVRYSGSSGGFDIDRELEKVIEQAKDRPGEGEIFSETAESMIRVLVNIVWIDQAESIAYMKPLVSLVGAQRRLTVATLNYDNSIELLAQSASVSCTTGIDKWSETGSFIPSSDGIFLIKLHGSIDWALEGDQRSEDRPMPHSIIRQVSAGEIKEPGFRPGVIFGQRNKLTAEGPFLDLLRAFQQELSRSDILTVVGYSFRDDHVNEYISQWLNQSKERKMRIINPHFDRSPSPYAGQLSRFGGTQVEIIREPAGAGLVKLYSYSIVIVPSVTQPSSVSAEPTT
ncbi:SIR2 family protein [Candidatus Methylomirabilis sp.]|uniref:SIR2 family protein n=1 Tax=Candidatus Methylomirabilis sp. TaxID=2032687 RepID=UPI003076126A